MRQIGATIHIGPNPTYQNMLQKQQDSQWDSNSYPALSSKAMEEILSIENVLGIEAMNALSISDATPINFTNCKKHTGVDPQNQELNMGLTISTATKQILRDSVNFVGCNHVELFDYFRRNLSTLTDGQYPTEENRGAVISRELAQTNGFSVGDVLEISPFEISADLTNSEQMEEIILSTPLYISFLLR